MWKWTTILLLVCMASPALAARTMSVEQMEKLLVRLHNKPDGKVAGELEDAQLTERVSLARLTRWEAAFPGKRAHEQLMKLADESAFLDPPTTDVISDPRPDIDAQRQMLWKTLQYVKTTTSRLPDLFATRLTTHFENTQPQSLNFSVSSLGQGNRTVDAPVQSMETGPPGGSESLHSTDEYSRTVTYRDGHEVPYADAGTRRKEEGPGIGLTTSGEFGPILALVIGDAMHGGFRWLRWERGTAGPLAEFLYAVPDNQSHYRVGVTSGEKVEELYPAYHGEIEIDPASGDILRLTVVTHMTPGQAAMQAAIAVEYAPVTIGDRSYICPVRGVAFSKFLPPGTASTTVGVAPVQIKLNDVAFTQYHLFGSEVRMVANESVSAGARETGAPASTAPAAAGPAGSPEPAKEAAAPPAPVSAAAAAEEFQSMPRPNPAPAPVAASASQVAGDASKGARTNTPALATTDSSAEEATDAARGEPAAATVLHVNSRIVVVDVVVTERNRPVQGLDRSRFHIFQDGQEQAIASFEENEPASAASSATMGQPPALPADTYSNLPTYPTAGAVTVLLLDGLNTEAPDQLYVRREMIRYLKTLPPGRPIAIFTLGSKLRLVQGFTADTGKLMAAMADKKATAPASLRPAPEQRIEEQAETDRMTDAHSSELMIANVRNFMSEADTAQTGMRAQLTLEAMQEIARYLGGIPGRKNLVWFSGSFPLQFFAKTIPASQASAKTAAPGYADAAGYMLPTGSYDKQLRITADLFAAARVAVYPVDARGVLSQSMFTATQQPNYSRTPLRFSGDTQTGMLQTGAEHTSMDVLAQETGGRAVHDSNGLQEAFADALSDGSSYYALSYIPPEDNADRNDDEFHRIEVRVDGGKYQLAYRSGYYDEHAPAPASTVGGMPAAMTEATVLGAPPSTQILLQARVLPADDPRLRGAVVNGGSSGNRPTDLSGGPHRYIVDLSVKPAGLTFTQGTDGSSHAHMDCALLVYDAEGKVVNTLGRAFAFSFSPQQFERLQTGGGAVPVRLGIDLPAGDVALRVVVYDPESAKTGSFEVPVQVQGK